MSITLHFELQLESDYHVGAGGGLDPWVDSALLRDADGVPVLRSLLRGLLRQALDELLHTQALEPYAQAHIRCQQSGRIGEQEPLYCGQKGPVAQLCPVCRILGSPAYPGHWRIRVARPTQALQPLGKRERWQPLTDGAHTATHVRISPRTRRAEPRKLFAQEEGDRLTFRFTASCLAEDEAAITEAAWLVAAARWVRHLGRGRRRGRGRCRIALQDEGTTGPFRAQSEGSSCQNWLLERFAQTYSQSFLAPGAISRTATKAGPTPFGSSGQPVRLRVLVRLEEPLLIAECSEVGNELSSLNYIPGVAVRGALAARVAACCDLSQQMNQGYQDFVGLFFREAVQFLPLYPARPSDPEANMFYPTIPAPRDLYTCEVYPGFESDKYDPHGAQGLASYPTDALLPRKCKRCDATLRPWEGLVTLGSTPREFKLLSMHEPHVGINHHTHKAQPGVLYTYNALAAGQYFVGEIRCASDDVRNALLRLTGLICNQPESLLLGKGAGRGYGAVTLWLQEGQENDLPLWCPQPLGQRIADPSQLFTLTLLSDTILADPWGRFRATLDDEGLAEALGFAVQVQRVFCATRPVDGFSAHLGLPRWRDIALRAGSTVSLQANAPPGDWLAKLQRAEDEGIGLRRHEGFGRVAINHPLCHARKGAVPQGLYREPIPVPGALRQSTDSLGAVQAERDFRRRWQGRMGQPRWDWPAFRQPEFLALTRLLADRKPDSADALKKLLDKVGRIKDEALDPLAKDLQVREEEKIPALQKKGQDGLAQLSKLAEALQYCLNSEPEARTDQKLRQRLWAVGLTMLLERIAAQAQEAAAQEKQG